MLGTDADATGTIGMTSTPALEGYLTLPRGDRYRSVEGSDEGPLASPAAPAGEAKLEVAEGRHLQTSRHYHAA